MSWKVQRWVLLAVVALYVAMRVYRGAAICMEERILCGSYSSSVDLQSESAELVFSGDLPVEQLISHRFSLNEIHHGIDRALHPDDGSLKIVIQPQR